MKPQVIKLPKKEEALEAIPLANDRPLEADEEEAEEKAIKLPRKRFKRIPPVPGTLGYLFRDLSGGNAAVFEFINNSLDKSHRVKSNTTAYKIYRVILMWNALDEFSQKRVDVFDWLCNEVGIAKDKFYAQAAQGMYDHYEAVSQRILMESKVDLINNVRQFARKERNYRDRELLAKATGTTKDSPLIGSIDNSNKVTNNNLTFESGFRDTLRATEKLTRADDPSFIEAEIIEERPRQLTEGNLEDMISAEDILSVLDKEEEEKVH
jgi:hypothetical protein